MADPENAKTRDPEQIEAAARAICLHALGSRAPCDNCKYLARLALAAAETAQSAPLVSEAEPMASPDYEAIAEDWMQRDLRALTERDEARAQAARLADALRGLVVCLTEGGNGEGWTIAQFLEPAERELANYDAARGNS